jgi:predicted ester cyclase
MAKKDERYSNKSSFAYVPASLTETNALTPYDHSIDEELILSLFKTWNDRNYEEFDHYYSDQSIVHAICNTRLTGPANIAGFVRNLLDSFPDATVTVERITSNQSKDKTELAARWIIRGTHNGNGFFKGSTGIPVIVMGISHFIIKDGRIAEEWMVFDGFDVLCQIHANNAIEQSPSSNGTSKLPSIESETLTTEYGSVIHKELNETAGGKKSADSILTKYLSKDVVVFITKPFKELSGIEAFAEGFWQPLTHSFPDLELQPYILFGGEHNRKDGYAFPAN